MFFYTINAKLTIEEVRNTEGPRGIHPSEDWKEEIASLTEKFNNERMDGGYILCARIKGKKGEFALASPEQITSDQIVYDYFDALELEGKVYSMHEAKINDFCGKVRMASRHDLIEDCDCVMQSLKLDWMHGPFLFGENMIAEVEKEKLFVLADKYLMKQSLYEEFTRMYQTKKDKFVGHPVHYMIQVDDTDARREITRLVLSAIKGANRVLSERYFYIDFNKDERWMSPYDLDAAYQTCVGGTVVVRTNMDLSDCGDEAGIEHEIVNAISSCMLKYRHKVLTILCLPVEATRIKSLFYEKLGSIKLVELVEDKAKDEAARDFLRNLAKENGVKCNKKLLNMVEAGETYTASELHMIFDNWYDVIIQQSAFPQYKEMEVANKKVLKEKNKGTAYERLQKMIGLTEAKKVIDRALAYYKFQKLYKDQEEKSKRPSMHMVFTGNPGTAKTSVARLVAAIFRENEILSSGHLVEVGRSELVGAYVGWTAKTVKRKFEQAKGGILFIDEAYSLVDDRKGSFGDEAINTIVQEMENHRDDVVVILAGYQKEMEHFLETNPGLRSRIAFHVPFADYNADELTKIAELMASDQKMRLSTDAVGRIHEISESACRQEAFGNGHYIRNLMERATMAHAQRIIDMGEIEHSKKLLTTLEAEDFEEIQMRHVEKKSIGFAG